MNDASGTGVDVFTLWLVVAGLLLFGAGLVCGLALAARHELRKSSMQRHPSYHGYTAQDWRHWVRHHAD